jgi:hypothetical protein
MQIKRLFPLKKINTEDISIDDLYDRLYVTIEKRKLKKKTLGYIDDWPIYIVAPSIDINKPNLLFAAGFHGPEIAGCWGIINFLENAPKRLFESVNVSFIPLVNPTGLELGSRNNKWEENPNRGFCHKSRNRNDVSQEGILLQENIDLIISLAKDCFISLHEDPDLEHFYLYTYEKQDAPGEWSKLIKNTLNTIFDPIPKKMEKTDFDHMVNSTVFKCCDGSFEDHLFHLGVPLTATTETPGQKDLKKRIQANSTVIAAVVRYMAKNQLKTSLNK